MTWFVSLLWSITTSWRSWTSVLFTPSGTVCNWNRCSIVLLIASTGTTFLVSVWKCFDNPVMSLIAVASSMHVFDYFQCSRNPFPHCQLVLLNPSIVKQWGLRRKYAYSNVLTTWSDWIHYEIFAPSQQDDPMFMSEHINIIILNN